MKIALLADIHGNYHALEAVLADIENERPDLTLVLGDIVFKGPEPERCLERIRGLNTVVLQGNIDELVGKNRIQPGFAKTKEQEAALRQEMEWTRARLSEPQLAYLAELPFSHEVQVSEKLRLRCVHANPNNLLDSYLPTDDDGKLMAMFAESSADIVAYAHIHQPFVRYLNGKALFNTGSVGLPFDGDPRASYAMLEAENDKFHIAIRRIGYDVERTVRAFEGSGHPFADSVIRALRSGRRPV